MFDTANRCYDDDRMADIDGSLHSYFPKLIGHNEVRAQHATHSMPGQLLRGLHQLMFFLVMDPETGQAPRYNA